MKRLFVMGAIALGLVMAPHQVTHAQTATTTIDPSKFALTAWDFPAPTKVLKTQVESNDQAANEKLVVHLGDKSYATLGRTTGYFMEAGTSTLDASGTDHPTLFYYLVSTFGSVDQATAAFTQEQAGWEQEVTSPTADVLAKVVDLGGQQVGDQMARGLYVAPISTSDGQLDMSELLFRRGPYLVQAWSVILDKDAATYGAAAQAALLAAAKKLDAVASGTVTAITPPANPPVDFNILAVRFDDKSTKKDNWNLQRSPLTKVKPGTEVQLGIYTFVKSAPPNARATDDYRLTTGKRTLHKSFTHNLGSYPPDYYHFYVYHLKLPRAGTYTFTGTVTINGVKHSAKASIKVSGKAVKAASMSLHGSAYTLPAAAGGHNALRALRTDAALAALTL